MDHGFGALECCGEGGRVAEVALDETRGGVDGGAMTLGQVVEDGHRVPRLDELADGVATDVAGAPGDEDLHRRPIPS
jgi:hypothetical protein